MTDNALIDALRCTARLIDYTLERALAPELNVPRLIVLRTVARADEPLSFAEVARALGCSKSTASHLATRLAVLGLLEVVAYAHAPHRRDVKITALGRQVLENANIKLGQIARRIGNALAAGDGERLAADLERLREAVRPSEKPRGDEKRIVGLLEPNPWLDSYVVRAMRKKEMVYGIEKERWEELTPRERSAQQEAFYYGGTMEEILAGKDLLIKTLHDLQRQSQEPEAARQEQEQAPPPEPTLPDLSGGSGDSP
jgi:DNA-binding MarR family transcriptional regulator